MKKTAVLTQTDVDGNVTVLAQVNGRNLNVFDDYIYYTDGEALMRLSRAGGFVETIFTAGEYNPPALCGE